MSEPISSAAGQLPPSGPPASKPQASPTGPHASQVVSADAQQAAFQRVAAVTGCAQHDDAYGRQSASAVLPDDPQAGFVAPLTDLSVLSTTGADSATFLHAQLTNDVAGLTQGTVRLAGYCSPKGRLLATFPIWRDADAIHMVVSQPLAAGVRKRLSMYVLRAKAVIHDESVSDAIIGVAGERGRAALQSLGIEPPAAMASAAVPAMPRPAGVWPVGMHAAPTAAVLGLPAAGTDAGALDRWLVVVPLDALAQIWPRLAAAAPVGSSVLWRWTEIRTGVPRIVQATSERLVPQMVNYELAGGVDFRKGCYPGQEVVARSQYLGKLKRRMFAAHTTDPEPLPGADVLADGLREPVGQVVMAAPDPSGGVTLLFEAATEHTKAAVLRLAVDGSPLALRDLPYALPA